MSDPVTTLVSTVDGLVKAQNPEVNVDDDGFLCTQIVPVEEEKSVSVSDPVQFFDGRGGSCDWFEVECDTHCDINIRGAQQQVDENGNDLSKENLNYQGIVNVLPINPGVSLFTSVDVPGLECFSFLQFEHQGGGRATIRTSFRNSPPASPPPARDVDERRGRAVRAPERKRKRQRVRTPKKASPPAAPGLKLNFDVADPRFGIPAREPEEVVPQVVVLDFKGDDVIAEENARIRSDRSEREEREETRKATSLFIRDLPSKIDDAYNLIIDINGKGAFVGSFGMTVSDWLRFNDNGFLGIMARDAPVPFGGVPGEVEISRRRRLLLRKSRTMFQRYFMILDILEKDQADLSIITRSDLEFEAEKLERSLPGVEWLDKNFFLKGREIDFSSNSAVDAFLVLARSLETVINALRHCRDGFNMEAWTRFKELSRVLIHDVGVPKGPKRFLENILREVIHARTPDQDQKRFRSLGGKKLVEVLDRLDEADQPDSLEEDVDEQGNLEDFEDDVELRLTDEEIEGDHEIARQLEIMGFLVPGVRLSAIGAGGGIAPFGGILNKPEKSQKKHKYAEDTRWFTVNKYDQTSTRLHRDQVAVGAGRYIQMACVAENNRRLFTSSFKKRAFRDWVVRSERSKTPFSKFPRTLLKVYRLLKANEKFISNGLVGPSLMTRMVKIVSRVVPGVFFSARGEIVLDRGATKEQKEAELASWNVGHPQIVLSRLLSIIDKRIFKKHKAPTTSSFNRDAFYMGLILRQIVINLVNSYDKARTESKYYPFFIYDTYKELRRRGKSFRTRAEERRSRNAARDRFLSRQAREREKERRRRKINIKKAKEKSRREHQEWLRRSKRKRKRIVVGFR